ncbi:MAG: 1-acyl-sn-glycerol-3-phosphate acyltransferase [Brumimicrobium sp.]
MRPLYFLLKFLLKLPLWIYYPRFLNVNKPKKRFARTIFASNHAASFMDPLVIAQTQPPIVFFMTRSDVFKPFLKPILWASHMFPIYREIDGTDTKSKNEAVFRKCYRVLKYGRSLIIFSEGFTDDIFIRRLKPIKKGAIRIGFGALEYTNWKKKIYIRAVGVNYSNPNSIGSDVVISNSDPICLNDYRQRYEEDPNKTIYELTKHVEIKMREQLTDVRNTSWAPTHEYIMRLTRKGMNAVDTDKSIPLLKRWEYSKSLASWINEQDLDNNSRLIELKKKLKDYFDLLNNEKLEEQHIYKMSNQKWSKAKDLMYFILLAPIMVVGLIHNYLPYIFIKKFVEKAFRRKVFWGSVKMMLGIVAIGLFNIPFIFLGYYLLCPSWLFWIGYSLTVAPLSGIVAYGYFKKMKAYRVIVNASKRNLSHIYSQREALINEIHELIPVA